jgi:hypothetical protein
MNLHGLQSRKGRKAAHADDIIFPKIDMCLITWVGWFNPSPTKNNFDIRSLI